MKKLIFKGLYTIVLNLSNRFNIRLLSGLKIFLGTSLLVLMSSCQKPEKEEVPEVTCYDPIMPTEATCYIVAPSQETIDPEPTQPASTTIDLNNS